MFAMAWQGASGTWGSVASTVCREGGRATELQSSSTGRWCFLSSVLLEQDLPGIVLGKREGEKKGKGSKT